MIERDEKEITDLPQKQRLAIREMDAWTDEERMQVLRCYCSHCGGENGCQCWNDE